MSENDLVERLCKAGDLVERLRLPIARPGVSVNELIAEAANQLDSMISWNKWQRGRRELLRKMLQVAHEWGGSRLCPVCDVGYSGECSCIGISSPTGEYSQAQVQAALSEEAP